MGSFQEGVDNKDVYWNEEPYCSLLRKNLMTCAKLYFIFDIFQIN